MAAGILRAIRSHRIAFVSTLLVTAVTFGVAARTALAFQNQPPVITSFSVSNPLANYWVFEGVVEDENRGGCTIAFGGVLEGHYTECDQDGTFAYVLELGPTQEGIVTAQAVDPYKLVSEIVSAPVLQ